MKPSEASHLTYSFPWGYRILMYVSVGIYFFLGFGCIYVGNIDRDVNPHALFVVELGVIFVLCGIYSIAVAARLGEIVTVTDTHISQTSANGSALTLHWNEIVAVKNRRFLGRIELLTDTPKRKMYLEYQLHDFAGLLMMVEHRVADNTPITESN